MTAGRVNALRMCECNVNAMGTQWECNGNAMGMPWECNENAM